MRQRMPEGTACRHAADTHGLLALLDFDLGDAGFLQQLDQFLDFSYVHAGSAPKGSEMSRALRASGCAGEPQRSGAHRRFIAEGAQPTDDAHGDVGEIAMPPECLASVDVG